MASMPTVAFPGDITVVDTVEKAEAAMAILRGCEVVGFDTETKPSFKKGQLNNVSLIQISTFSDCYLFRVNKSGVYDVMRELLETENVVKIGLSTKDDFNVLRRIGPLNPQGFIELQEYVKRFGIDESSLQKIYAIIFGQRISKSQRLSNWEASTLTPSQCAYASIDAWACLRIYETLSSGAFDPNSSPYKTTENL